MRRRATGIRRRAACGAALLALTAVLQARDGACQTVDERAGARAAAQEGTKALREQRWAEAIDFFTRAESLVHAPPHVLYMARAQVGAGLLVQARENLHTLVRTELPAGAPRAFKQAQDEAREDLKALDPRIPYVTVTVKGAGASDFAVTQDGNRIPNALVGVPRPVDPGAHTFEAIAQGLKGTATIQLKETERQRIVLEMKPADVSALPALTNPAGAAEEKPAGPPPAAAASAPPGADTSTTASTSSMNGMRLGSYIAFGVGGAGLVAGTIFALQAGSKATEADGLFKKYNCADTGCPDQRSEVDGVDDKAKSARTLAMVGFIVGGVGVGAGVTLFVLSGDSSDKAASSGRLRVAASPSSVSLSGVF